MLSAESEAAQTSRLCLRLWTCRHHFLCRRPPRAELWIAMESVIALWLSVCGVWKLCSPPHLKPSRLIVRVCPGQHREMQLSALFLADQPRCTRNYRSAICTYVVGVCWAALHVGAILQSVSSASRSSAPFGGGPCFEHQLSRFCSACLA